MQYVISNTRNSSIDAGLRGCAVLTLCLALAACKPSVPEATTTATPAATLQAAVEPVAAAPVATAPVAADTPASANAQAPTAPATDTVDDDDLDPGLDDSYNIADLRPEYKACIDASDMVMPEVRECQEQEFAFQRRRMIAALDRIDAGPDSYFKDEIGNWQDVYLRYTDSNCTAVEERGPAGEGLSCRINRYANRANALEGLADMADMADKAYAKGH